MRRIFSGMMVLLLGITPAAAETFGMSSWNGPVELAQGPSVTIGPNGLTIGRDNDRRDRDRYDRDRDRWDRDRERRRDRFVCVVQPPRSMDRRRPFVCNAGPGRVGERCRCSGVPGTGRLDIDR